MPQGNENFRNPSGVMPEGKWMPSVDWCHACRQWNIHLLGGVMPVGKETIASKMVPCLAIIHPHSR